MGIRQFRPMTPGTRFRSVSDFAEITKSEPEKSLLEPLQRTGGLSGRTGRRSAWKKAIVTLKEGDAIAVFEG